MRQKADVVEQVHQQALQALKRAQLDLDKPLVVAVSGGPDSLTLLYALVHLREALGLRLHGAHLDHGLRGSQGMKDARFVAETFHSLGIPATIERADVLSVRAKEGLSLEEAARKVRYSFLARVATGVGAEAVALGHTADDQAETVLMHLIRGSGLTGLRGMKAVSRWKAPGDEAGLVLVRPLLKVTREETEAYCHAQGLEPRQDESNLSPEFARNRIRNQLFPALKEYNPNVRDALIRLARSVALDLAYLEGEVDRVWPNVVRLEPWGLAINRRAFSTLAPAIQHHLLRKAIQQVKGDLEGVEMSHVQDIIELLGGPAGKALDLPSDVCFSVSYGEATITTGQRLLCPFPALEGEHRLAVPGETQVSGWRIKVSSVSPAEGLPANDPWIAHMDLGEVGTELWVRTRRPGDRFHPFGMAMEKKIQDFMTDAKVPRSWRDRVPLVVSPRGIAWVVGHRIAEWARVRDETGQVLAVEFRQTNG